MRPREARKNSIGPDWNPLLLLLCLVQGLRQNPPGFLYLHVKDSVSRRMFLALRFYEIVLTKLREHVPPRALPDRRPIVAVVDVFRYSVVTVV